MIVTNVQANIKSMQKLKCIESFMNFTSNYFLTFNIFEGFWQLGLETNETEKVTPNAFFGSLQENKYGINRYFEGFWWSTCSEKDFNHFIKIILNIFF